MTQSATVENASSSSSIAQQLQNIAASGQRSVWEGVKDHSISGLNIGVTIGVAVVVVSLVGAACSFIPRNKENTVI